jgi:hypothetical protein
VNQITAGDQERPHVAFNSNGDFLVVWRGPSTAEDETYDIHARPFDAAGAPLGPEQRLSEERPVHQHSPRVVARRPQGMAGPWEGYLVAWTETGVGTLGLEVAADGTPLGESFFIDESGESEGQVALAVRATGETLATWRSYAFAAIAQLTRRFRPGLFDDGFESGDTSAWSEVAK